VAVQGQTHDLDAVIGRGTRHLFMVPWNGRTLIGVWHRVFRTPTEAIDIGRDEIEAWLGEINASCPGMDLRVEDVLSWDYGLVPFGEGDPQSSDLHFGHESVFLDHGALDGVERLLSLIGIRYTMGRADAERAVDWAFRTLGRTSPASRTACTPVHGGDISDLDQLAGEVAARTHAVGVADRATALLRHYGTDYQAVLAAIEAHPALTRRCGDDPVTAAEILHAVHHEAALTLEDLVLRRTDMGATGCPTERSLRACAEIAGEALNWTHEEIDRQIEGVRRFYPDFRGAAAGFTSVERERGALA
jgi:glycerol-3-phosphate dehydrogenase